MRAAVLEADGGDVDAKAFDVAHRAQLAAPKTIRRAKKSRALHAGDARERPFVRAFAARTHLDHHDERPASRDEIDLERAEPQVLREDREAVRVQIVGDRALGAPSEIVPRAQSCPLPQFFCEASQLRPQELARLKSVLSFTQ